jgi:ribosomal protein S18 acetylase RimI-like enzyme
MNIRPFQYKDIDDLIRLAQVSFAEEQLAQGTTPEKFANQVKMMARGRMIPFKLLTNLARIKWGFFVAEVDDKIVGCGGYLGQKRHIELISLMVAPSYRRQGIGQKLLIKRLEYLTDKGYPFVTTSVLAHNHASLGNLQKQGFEIFDRYTIFVTELPLTDIKPSPVIESRLIQESDKATFIALEKQAVDPTILQLSGSKKAVFFPPLSRRILSKFTGSLTWQRAFTKQETIIGFLQASTSNNRYKGLLSRPIIAEENRATCLPVMLDKATEWLADLGKTEARIAIPDAQIEVAESLQTKGWVKQHSWVRLVKWLR